jgi:small subunit ribosomal protein S2
MVDLPIPGNDDGIRSIELILSHLADAVISGAKDLTQKQEGNESAPSKSKAAAEVAR